MESITIKVEDDLAKEIEKAMRPYYSTKTEFIREALRDKLKELKKQEALMHFDKNIGFAKSKISTKKYEQARKNVAKEYAKKEGIKLK
jgi:metal-responsive CopG/Arc/MetJ family transcriptional regulator